ncbi:MAG: SRPBCC family protein [Acidobacteria bacterium]|nr:SRPBCC family protein [Acidobacteriota bacterium]
MAQTTVKWATWLPVVAAGAVTAYALTRRQPQRANGHGTGVIADHGSDTRQQLGGPAGIHVEEAVTVNRPVTDLFRFWRNFENLPSFMRHLDLVAEREGGITHWVAKGPAGMRVEWDARIINEIDNKLIGWQSLEGSMVSTAGSVNFRELPRGTEVRIHLQYNPPAGRLGAAVAWLFGEEPNLQVREDLRRFKQLIETGE